MHYKKPIVVRQIPATLTVLQVNRQHLAQLHDAIIFPFDGSPDNPRMAVEGVHGVKADHEVPQPDITVTGPANVVAEAPDMVEQDRA